jgi:predicted lipoprotein with Yx(FWY)xxD motif/cytochrome c5
VFARIPLSLKRLVVAAASIVLVTALAQQDAPRLDVRDDAVLGTHLVDGQGRTLYLFTNDVDGVSACYEACATNWPPMLSDGDVATGEGVDPTLIGSTERTDGSVQVTYGGWPLYTFIGDAEPGQANGQGRNDVWFVVAPDGTGVGAPAAAEGDDAALVAELMSTGARVFAQICAACHGDRGNEARAAHVAILENNRRVADARFTVRRVLRGGGYMPGFGGQLSDFEGAAVATLVRNSWGNDYGIVTEEEAAGWR